MSDSWVLAIDFGTTTTAAAVRRTEEDRAELIRFGDSYRIPSAVLLSEEGLLVTGPQVDREAELAPERLERFPKRQLGQGKVLLAGAWFDDVDLVAAVLDHVYRQALPLFDGVAPAAVRLTHPSRWEGIRQEKLRRAAEKAGLPNVELLPEPVAAARALTRRHAGRVAEGQMVAVFDFGGGTLDIALLRRTGDTFMPIGEPAGDDHLGGEDVDDLLIAFLAAKLSPADRDRLFDVETTEDPDLWRRAAYALARQVKQAKEALSTGRVQRLALASPPLELKSIELTEADLTTAVGGMVQRAADRLHAALHRSTGTADALALVFLVGGSSRLALVQRKLGPSLTVPLVTYGDPKGVVALGAAEVPLQKRVDPHVAPVAGPIVQRRAEAGGSERTRSSDQLETRQRVTDHALMQTRTDVDARQLSDARLRTGPVPHRRTEPTLGPLPQTRGGAADPGGRALANAGDRAHQLFAGDLFHQVGRPPRAQLTQWLVAAGDHVTLGAPLAVLAVPGLVRPPPRVVVSPCAGLVVAHCRPAGTVVEAQEPLVDLSRVTAVVIFPGRDDEARHTGFVLDVLAAQAARPASDAVFVRIDGVSYAVTFRTRFAFFTTPGLHTVEATCRFGRQWGPYVAMSLTVHAHHQGTIQYLPPAALHQPGRLWQQA